MARMILGSTAGAVVALATATRADADAGAGDAAVPCARVDAAAELPAAWAEALAELRAQIAKLRAGECEPMVLSLAVAADGRSARVAATASDGRRTERDVARPEALVATGLGLLMSVPPGSTSTPTATATATSTPTSTPTPAPTSTATEIPNPASIPPHALRLWLGLDLGGRATAPTSMAMIDVRATGQLLLDHWMLAIALGGAPTAVTSQQGLDRDAYREVSAALELGHRFDLGSAALDVGGDLAIVAMRMEYDFADGRETTGSDVELGLGALARFCLPLGPSWALTLAAEGRALPGNAISASLLEVPQGETAGPGAPPTFPAWSAALRVGVMGELLR
ncbi:MAG TPA: hypothetical protein VF765_09195 [Polyangiaceae bacterium]